MKKGGKKQRGDEKTKHEEHTRDNREYTVC